MRADGTQQRPLTRTSASESSPDWSPTGTRIAYTRDDDVFVMNANGSGQHRLLRGGENPSWSPDESTVVFDRGAGLIFTIHADGSGMRKIFPRGDLLCTSCAEPVWSPK